jgi:hypothetical protein
MTKELSSFIFKETLKKIYIGYAAQKHSPLLGAAKLITLSNVKQAVNKQTG